MTKITFIGAGSTVFAKNLIGDILSYPEFAEVTISLHDIDEDRLATTEIVAHKIAQALDVKPVIEVTTNLRYALNNADYAIGMYQIGGYKPGTVIDFEIPKKYGLRQTIADTLGIGGIMRGLRTIPPTLAMCKVMEEICPDVTFLNYVNPMAINTWAVYRATPIKVVGLCHSVQDTARQLAQDIKVPLAEINYLCAGINHMAFYLRFERDGATEKEDLYPLIRQVVGEGRVPPWNRVRYEVLSRLGYFVTESSEHFVEYVPWFIKRDRPDLIKQYNIPLDEYIDRCENQIAAWEQMRAVLENEDVPLFVERSKEYGATIIHSLETGQPAIINGNVRNDGLIDNLPAGCCVELPCFVDKNGIQPTYVGKLPPQLAALMQTNINVQSLTVEAALTGRKEHIYHAAMLDPHTAAELDLEQIWTLVDEMVEAHGDWLPTYESSQTTPAIIGSDNYE